MQRIKAATRPARAPPPCCTLSLWRRRPCRFQLIIIIAGIKCTADTNHSQLELQAVDFAIMHYLWSKAVTLSVIAPYRGRHPQKFVFEPETPPFDLIMLESANNQNSRGRKLRSFLDLRMLIVCQSVHVTGISHSGLPSSQVLA